jgi:hypothetical protein
MDCPSDETIKKRKKKNGRDLLGEAIRRRASKNGLCSDWSEGGASIYKNQKHTTNMLVDRQRYGMKKIGEEWRLQVEGVKEDGPLRYEIVLEKISYKNQKEIDIQKEKKYDIALKKKRLNNKNRKQNKKDTKNHKKIEPPVPRPCSSQKPKKEEIGAEALKIRWLKKKNDGNDRLGWSSQGVGR